MERTDIEYLNIPEPIKKKLYAKNLNTIEKLSTNYLENITSEEINLIQEEVFKCHLQELAIEENEKEYNLIVNSLILSNNIYSLSDKDNYNVNGSSDFSEVSTFSSSSSSFESSIDYDLMNEKKENIKKTISYNINTTTTSDNDIIFKNKKYNNQNENIYKEKLGRKFLLYSNFMKKNLKNHKLYKTDDASLNNLLCGGIESSKIYFFYGNKIKINKTVLVNLLFDTLVCSNKNSSIVYIYFSYINDITSIHNIIIEKIKKQKEHTSLEVILRNFYIFRVQNINELTSFLLHIKNKFLKSKNSENSMKNEFNNIISIGIFNFTDLIKNLNIINSSSYFYLVRELKILSIILNIPILIFDCAKNEVDITNNKINYKEQKVEGYKKIERELKEQRKSTKIKKLCKVFSNSNEYSYTNEENLLALEEDEESYLRKKNNKIMNNNHEYNSSSNSENIDNSEILSEYESTEEYEHDQDSENTDNSMNICINNIIEHNISERKTTNNKKNNLSYHIKEDIKKPLVPYSIYNTFDFCIEIELINKIKNKKLVRFTLLKSQNNIKYFYSYSYIINHMLFGLM